MLANIPTLRKEALLAHVEELVGELHDAPVYYLRNRQQLAGRGISRSAHFTRRRILAAASRSRGPRPVRGPSSSTR